MVGASYSTAEYELGMWNCTYTGIPILQYLCSDKFMAVLFRRVPSVGSSATSWERGFSIMFAHGSGTIWLPSDKASHWKRIYSGGILARIWIIMKDFSTIDYLEPEEQSKTHSAYWHQNDVCLVSLSMYQWRAQVKLSKLAAAFTIICGTLLRMEDIKGEAPPGAWRVIP